MPAVWGDGKAHAHALSHTLKLSVACRVRWAVTSMTSATRQLASMQAVVRTFPCNVHAVCLYVLAHRARPSPVLAPTPFVQHMMAKQRMKNAKVAARGNSHAGLQQQQQQANKRRGGGVLMETYHTAAQAVAHGVAR